MVLILLDVQYNKDINRAVLKFYDTDRLTIVLYTDQTIFRPYCIAKVLPENFYLFCYKNTENKDISPKKEPKFPKKSKSEEDSDDTETEESDNTELEEIDDGIDRPIPSPKKTGKKTNKLDWTDVEKIADTEEEYSQIPSFPSLPIEPVTKFNPLTQRKELMTKIYGITPLDITDQYKMGGVNISSFLVIKEDERIDNYAYENRIYYRYNYIFDKQLVFGMPYTLEKREVEIKESKKCPLCDYSKGYFIYYIKKESTADHSNIVLTQIICEGCNGIIYTNKAINLDQYIPYFRVQREFDLETVVRKKVIPVPSPVNISNDIKEKITDLFQHETPAEKQLVQLWIPYFFAEIPIKMYRVAMDIEIYSERDDLPPADQPTNPVSCVNFTDIDGKSITFVLKVWKTDGDKPNGMPEDVKIIEFGQNEEKELLIEVFKYIERYPILVTFNGNAFDLPYLYFRAIKKGIAKEEIPFSVKPRRGMQGLVSFECHLKFGLHFDLYEFFSSRSLKGYAFKNAYVKVGLGDVTKALLPNGKTKIVTTQPDGSVKPMSLYTKWELIYYNWTDSQITLDLTTYDNYIVMNLLFIMLRLSKTGLEDFTAHQISYWIKNLIYFEHRRMDWIIPQQEQLRHITTACTQAKSKDKDFEGAVVIDTKSGVHFDVVVMDFASLYPSIIKTRNLSYETVDCCHHPQCKKVIVPETTHWICQQTQGVMALLIGTIRDVRVMYFKDTEETNKKIIDELKELNKKDEALTLSQINKYYGVIQNALKVFINAGYGVFASDDFYFYQIGMAESVTAFGRFSIRSLIEQVEKRNIQVIMGDTDSCGLLNPNKDDIEYLIKWAWDELHIILDKDKECKYMAISDRKKNYFASFKQKANITPESPLWKKPEIKGLKGKKSNTPPFIKTKFNEIIKWLDINIQTKADLPNAILYIDSFLEKIVKDIIKYQIPLKDMTFTVRLSKDVGDYGEYQDENHALLSKAKMGSSFGRRQLDSFTAKIVEDKPRSAEERLKNAYMQFNTKGMNQTAKCGLLLLQAGKKIGKGDFISYIKTVNGAIPIELCDTTEEIDTRTYLNELASTFGQIYDCFGVDVQPIIDQAKESRKITTLTMFTAKK